jgi:predicted nucleotidyltransferase
MVRSRREIIRRLRHFSRTRGEEFGVIRIGVFGSAARDKLTERSDVDVVVELTEPDLLLLVGIKQELEEVFGRPVDIVQYRPTMNSFLKRHIEQEAVYAS